MTEIPANAAELKTLLPILKEKETAGLILPSYAKAVDLVRWAESGRPFTEKQDLFVGRLILRAKRKHRNVKVEIDAKSADVESVVATVLERIGEQRVDVDEVIRAVEPRVLAAIESRKPREVLVEVRRADGKKYKVRGEKHAMFERLLRAATTRMPNGFAPGIFLQGEASSGKTTGAHMLAEALGLKWHFNGAISFPHEMLGFIDGAGKYHRTPFRENLVQSSEEYLRSIEDQVPMSRGWRNVDDVVGALPNVPAYLAGHPQSMRRRVRTMRDTAPLSVFVDLTSSGGIDSAKVTRRGVVLLALVRLLVEHRAVELWVGSALGPRSTYSRASWTTAWRVDTAPLDLARAAYHVGATAMSRGFGYGVCKGRGSGGRWPFNHYGLHTQTAEQRLKDVFPGQEVMYVPPIYLNDPMTANPVGWLRRVMEKYVTGGEEQ